MKSYGQTLREQAIRAIEEGMVSHKPTIEQIHDSLINGQKKQMVEQINEYGVEFWKDYRDYLTNLYYEGTSKFLYFSQCVISYHTIKGE